MRKKYFDVYCQISLKPSVKREWMSKLNARALPLFLYFLGGESEDG